MDLVWQIIFGYLVLMNIVTLGLFGSDKSRAVAGRSRISEAALLSASFLGGAAGGALGMRLFRHKTRKEGFKLIMTMAILVNLAAYGRLMYMYLTGTGLGLFGL